MIQGSIVALVTPMHPDGSVDYEALRRLIDFHVENGTDAIVSVGTTGESATLPEKEHCEVMSRTIEIAAGRIPIIAGTGANSTSEAMSLTKSAAQMGADACLLVTPYYNKPTQEGMYLHFKTIAEQVDVPQILYNVPGRTAVDLLPETVFRLAELPNIVGIKEATGDLERARQLISGVPENFMVYSGDDATAREFMLLGGKGDISVTANVAPAIMHAMCAAAISGNAEEAAALDAKVQQLHEVLFVEANPIPVKWALKEMGLIGEAIRLPLTPLSEQYRDLIRQALKSAGLIN